MLKISKIKGVTLLEMLLVIAVTTTLMVGTLSLMRNKALNVKNDKTVLVMQQWLQAAISYYVVNQGDARQGDLTKILMQGQFIPPGADKNPWDKPYNVSLNNKTIVVTTVVPDSQVKIIQGNLPYSLTVKSNVTGTVTLASPVPIPDAAAIQYTDIVAGTQANPAIVMPPKCPDELKPEIFTVPVMYSSGQTSYPIVQVGAYAEAVYLDAQKTKIKEWHVFSKLYTVKGAADNNADFTTYNKILVMTKCPKISEQLQTNNIEQLEDDPLINFK
ncbi:MAG: hypothetical protein K0S11_1301 [Gammaproteobacteria bacterium]|jgi:competence protein ComGC|nr:hypothetical protein [Gammaproteobacteria bacterium]